MKANYHALKLTDSVYWVGAVDWKIREFHGYATNCGTTYNAYLILADKITLVDTVKKPFKDELLARISDVIDPHDIQYIISNHSEMDHSGCLPEIIDTVNPEKVFASVTGVKVLSEHFRDAIQITGVKTGDILDIGNKHLRFLETKMLHWPESMFTYLVEDAILFSQDAFGIHMATEERFADAIEENLIRYEMAKYYANILLPYSNLVLNLLFSVKTENLPINMLATDHGPIFRKDIGKILNWYESWARQEPKQKAVIFFDTMWGSTALMAQSIAEGLDATGISVKQMPLSVFHRSEVITEILECGAIAVGSPTLNNNLFPSVADALVYLKGLRPKNLLGLAFGSYGWGGESIKQIAEYFEAMKIELVSELKVKYVPDRNGLSECFEGGKKLGNILKGVCK